MMPILLLIAAFVDEPAIQYADIFPPEPKHNHASCIVELPNGDLLAAWYSGHGERTSDDVVILGSRLKKGGIAWSPRFPMADTAGYPDCNPALLAAPDGSLWMFWPTILDHRWEGALLKFAHAKDALASNADGSPSWTDHGVLHVTPEGFDRAMKEALGGLNGVALKLAESYFEKLEERSKDLLYQRLGWMPRVHPTVLPSGRWLLPLYSDTFSCSIIAMTDDRGASWQFSRPLIGFGNIQPSLVRRDDGSIVAFMRDNGPHRKIRLSTSADEGKTWSPVTDSTFPNPGAGVEAIRLRNGHWALVYNDTVAGRYSLAVSLSDDEGKTWKWTRHVEKTGPGREQFHYPSILQTRDDMIHVTYTHGGTAKGSTIRHATFPESWIKVAEDAGPGAVKADEKRAFLELMKTLPHVGERFTDEAIDTAGPHLRVFLSFNEADLRDLNPFFFEGLMAALAERKPHRQFAAKHFHEIAHPKLRLYWGIALFARKEATPEVGEFLRAALKSKEYSAGLLGFTAPDFEKFKKEVEAGTPR